MRNRILDALVQARIGRQWWRCNSKLTQRLAAAAVQRDRQRGWAILENPSRLQVRTVDSFCESVVRQMPILSQFSVGRRKSAKTAMRSTGRLPGRRCACWRILRLTSHCRCKPCCSISTIIFTRGIVAGGDAEAARPVASRYWAVATAILPLS